eukprot:SAG11_NODE_9409_length_914_cov_2.282209_1_plen_33_part_10
MSGQHFYRARATSDSTIVVDDDAYLVQLTFHPN